MKKLSLVLFLVNVFLVGFSQEDWKVIHPYPTSNNLIDAHFYSETQGWICGTQGLIMHTNDGGETWEVQHQNPDEALWSIFFLGENLGWSVGWSKIYHTNNGGDSWESQDFPSVMGDLTDVFFINPDTGWIVGTYQIVLKTTDGGNTWTKIQNYLTAHKCFWSVSFPDELHGCAAGDWMLDDKGFIMVTNDGGLSWTETTPDWATNYQNVFFLDSLTGWACGWDGNLVKTTDGGYTWINKSISGSHNDILFFDYQQGLLLSDYETRITTDGGETWGGPFQMDATSSQRNMMSWEFNKVVSVGYGGSINRSVDGGRNWSRLHRGLNSGIKQIAFFNPLSGFVVQSFPYQSLKRTNDGGYSWYSDTLAPQGPFYEMEVSGNSAYLLNYTSQIVKTINAGNTWEVLDVPPSSDRYWDIDIIDQNTLYICGKNGELIKTVNGGHDWIDLSFYEDYNLTFMFWLDEDTGWIIDALNKKILYTNDGGGSWEMSSLIEELFTYQPESIYFLNATTGFASTWEAMLFKTTDGGVTWEPHHNFGGGNYSQIIFTTASEGWYRSSANVYHTFDAGHTWVNQQTFPQALRDMFFLDEQYGWVGGLNGLIAVHEPGMGIDDQRNSVQTIRIYPNPARDFFSVKTTKKSNAIRNIRIYNLNGKLIRKIPSNEAGNINISDLDAGTYLIEIRAGSLGYYEKLIKQ